MYEEEEAKRREEALQAEAAFTIQQRWKDFQQARDEERERERATNAPSAAAAAAATVQEVDLTPEEQREALLDEYRRLLVDRETTVEQNLAYQRILAKHLAEQRTRKGEDEGTALTTPEAEQTYWSLVRQMGEEKKRVANKRRGAEQELEQLRLHHQGTIDSAITQESNFRTYLRGMSTTAKFVRSSCPVPSEDIQQFLDTEEAQRSRIQSTRVRYLQLKNQAVKLRGSATDKDKHSDGMYLIDFEQLKIENTNLNEKIEERNEDLVKLRRKVTTTIHVLTHVKEKLEFMKGENAQLRQQVSATEDELNGVRDRLAQTKRRRDGFLHANLRMKEKMPLVGSEDLLLDYEKRKAVIDQTRVKVVELTDKHRQLLEFIDGQKPVIESLHRVISHYPS